MKLTFPGSVLGPLTFADLEVGGGSGDGSLLVYVGGAVSERAYAARRETAPARVLALVDSLQLGVSTLVISAPPALSGRPDEAAAPLARYVLDELLPALPFRPGSAGLVGFSLGGSLAVLMARFLPIPVRALSIVAGVGLTEALAIRGLPVGVLPCPVHVACNADDPCLPHALAFRRALLAAGTPVAVTTGPGGHGFDDYERNGLLREAFRFTARRLEPRAAGPAKP